MRHQILIATIVSLLCANQLFAQKIQNVEMKPLVERVSKTLKPIQGGQLKAPVITWGGDVKSIFAVQEGIFTQHGTELTVYEQNVLQQQVQDCIDGKTPFVRCTLGMFMPAAEALQAAGSDLVAVHLLTRSVGGDAMVVSDKIRTPADLKGKKIAVQLDGPHMDYLANILATAGLKPSDVTIVWFKELTLPKYDTRGAIVDPVSAFAADQSIDAVMCIIPDALALTSGGNVGTGTEGSRKGAKILLTTKTADHVIYDVYAVRKDYLDANKAKVQNFAHASLLAEEALQTLLAQKDQQEGRYKKLMSQSADMLLGSPQATADVEAMLADCAFSGHAENIAFFTGQGTTRNFNVISDEIQRSFLDMGLMKKRIKPIAAAWDYSALAKGLRNVGAAPVRSAFDTERAAQHIESQITAELDSWETDGTLFLIEINFDPNESEFSIEKYGPDFQKAVEVIMTYGGALVPLEGHSDPLGILKAKQKGERTEIVAQMEQAAKNLSLARADAVKRSFLEYCKQKGLVVDDSQLIPVGMGVKSPKFSPPRDKEEWSANRRVVFRIKQVEAELSEFSPLE